MRKWSPTSSLFRQPITHIHQNLNFLILYSPIQRHTDPMGLIHMPAGEDARFLPEGANQSGVTFEIGYTDLTLASQAQILSGDVHDHGEPLPAPIVPEHKKTGIFGEEMLSLCAVDFSYAGF